MVTRYDVFYVIASKGEIKVSEIVDELNKPKEEYQNIYNNVSRLERSGLIEKKEKVKVMHTDKSVQLFNLISFCLGNRINYNLLFKPRMLRFIQKAAGKEFFTRKDFNIHGQTFKLYVDALSSYGFLLILSRKPMKCKVLRHHFLSEVLKHFGLKLTFYKNSEYKFTQDIKKELRINKINQRIHKTAIGEIERAKEVNFIYASLNLEGNPITLPETQKLIEEAIVPEKHKIEHIEAITNYKKAVDYMIANTGKKVKISKNLFLEYHRIAMSQIKEAGIIRKRNVKIKNNPHFITSDWKEIPIKLDLLKRRYQEFESKKTKDIEEIISFASYFHNEFQRIHPFIDGNSRISRLLMWHIIRSYDIPVLDLPLGYFDEYLDLTKNSKKRDDKAFKRLVEEIVFINLRNLNNSLG